MDDDEVRQLTLDVRAPLAVRRYRWRNRALTLTALLEVRPLRSKDGSFA